jgi:hypothetical protein
MTLVIDGGLNLPMPKMVPIRQKFPRIEIANLEMEVSKLYRDFSAKSRIKPGAKIAITVGSRGIYGIDLIIKALIKELKIQGARPFIIPAMGSHGGATAEGQIQVLNQLGITEEAMEVPIISSMEVIEIGQLDNGMPVMVDKNALNSDGIIVVNRIKPHTGFKGEFESGLLKMMAIGLGKHKGASLAHQFGLGAFPELLPQLGQVVMEKAPILFGLAIIENAYDKTAILEFIDKDNLIAREKELLLKAKELLPRLYVSDVDVLIVQEMGKEISGPGIDPNITGRSPSSAFKKEYVSAPDIKRIVILELTEKTKGNANGMGIGDVITRRFFDKINFDYTYANTITATVLEASKIPIIMPTDYEAIQVALRTCNGVKHPESKIIWIKNTLQLEYIFVSETYLEEIKTKPQIEILGKPVPWPFSQDGRLEIQTK